MGAKALEVASLACGTCLRRSLGPFSCPSERFLDRGSRGFGAERLLSPRKEYLVDLNRGSPGHAYILQNGCVHNLQRIETGDGAEASDVYISLMDRGHPSDGEVIY